MHHGAFSLCIIFLQGLNLQVVDIVAEAEFILAHGTEAIGQSSGSAGPMELQDLEKILEDCAAKNIPMVVANPDYVTVEARALRVMPGNHFKFNFYHDSDSCQYLASWSMKFKTLNPKS